MKYHEDYVRLRRRGPLPGDAWEFEGSGQTIREAPPSFCQGSGAENNGYWFMEIKPEGKSN